MTEKLVNMGLEEAEELLAVTEEHTRASQEFADKLSQAIAEFRCPFVVGDILVAKDGSRAAIEQIRYRRNRAGYGLRARKFRKDGKPYAYSSDLYSADGYTLEETI